MSEAKYKFAPVEERFRDSMEAVHVPKIEHGHWLAECRRTSVGEGVSAQGAWTMRVSYEGEAVTLLFYARAHPENKYPPSEAVPSPVTLAGFLEYCQALAAKDTK